MPKCLRVASAGSAESIILSAGSTESMMLSACTERMDTLSAGAESIILSAPPAESMILSSVSSCYYAMLTATLRKKQQSAILISCRLRTLVNSTSTAALVGLPPKEAEFCYTSNRLLVRR